MFATGDLHTPPPRTPLQDNRTIGALVLLVGVLLCLALTLGIDSTVVVPYNATHAATQTWQAIHPPTIGPTPRRISPRRTNTPQPNGYFEAQAPADPGS